MPLDAFSVKDSQHWILFVWHIAPEIDDGRCSQCQPLVLFVQVLEKTLWTLKTLLTETFCMQNARLPCETKAPKSELVPCFLGWRINCPTHIQNYFQGSWLFTWLWLYIPTLQNHLEMLPQPGDMETILDHLLGPIIDRFPKLFFWAIYQGQWLELYINIFCLGSLYMLPAYPIRHTTILVLIFSRQEAIAIFPPNQANKCRQRGGKQKLCTAPCSSFTPPGGNSDAFMEAPACVEATKIDLFGCSIQSQTYGNRSLESYSLISGVAKPLWNWRGIFLPVYSSRAKKRCNC